MEIKKIMATALLAGCLFSTNAFAGDFTWGELLNGRMKLDKSFDYEVHVDSYMKNFRSAVWNRYRNDEFELQDKREETIRMMKDKANQFPLEEEMVINTTFEIGKYDFKKKMFPLAPLSESSYYYDINHSSGTLPRQLKVYFSNPDMIKDLPMEKNNAKAFVSRHKDTYGNVNRTVYGSLHFKLIQIKGSDSLLAKVTAAEVFEDNSRSKLLRKY